MQLARRLSLSAYYYGTQPLRWWRARAAARERRAPVMILFYHRIADTHLNPWTMRADDFARQLDWLESNFDLVSLAEAQARIRTNNPRPAVAITFDDGYADNCHFALPLLVKRRIPVMYFVTTRHIIHGEPFPHDVARGEPLQPNTVDELRSFASQGIEIGAHTRSHADLGSIKNIDTLFDEVVTAGEELQQAIGCPIRYFAFPYGQPANLNADVFHLAYDAGFEGVCSAYGGYNFPGDDAFHLQRFHADPELLRVKNWLTVDPRWTKQPRFTYQPTPARWRPQEATAE
jgi:peptidoglycan/xylan/chitin deacetylase (PgdA/CDA1 family)